MLYIHADTMTNMNIVRNEDGYIHDKTNEILNFSNWHICR